ncbi:hypothetical protein TrRE_jg8016 [Triparma retinervis]|uniref:Vta1/callose synthase N-terminal domain-containing protein n=1 Tax=Triparma retinervis TaxID=2557542 RepID=A0A9W6ZHD4_9STRA|nr:hypothetical protein TrRE_jg8016 [Triparma retinervis]
MDVPVSLKSIKPFIKRAEELDNDRTQPASRLVAYYCRQYALELAIPLLKTVNDPKAQECAMNIMNALEEEKKAVGEAFSKHEAYGIVRDFATKVLQGGDKQYEAVYSKNSRDYNSAKEDPFGIPEAPTSTPSFPAESKGGAEDDDSPPVFKPLAPAPAPAPSAPASAPSPEAAAPKRSSWFGSKKSSSTSKESITDAIELSKFAIAALEGKEIELARQRLQKALDCLK